MSYPRENTIPFQSAPAANVAAVATSPNPGTNARLRLRYVVVSYSAAPTGGKLTITDGAQVNWQIDIAASGTLVLPDLNLQCAAGAPIVITLAAGGAAVTGKVNAYATFE